MIAKTKIGASFKGVLNYLMSKVENNQGKIMETCGVRHETKHMIADFNMSRQANPNLTKCVWHTSLAFPASESLDDSKMLAIAKEWMDEMSLTRTQWVVIKHFDTNHPHLHIVCSRIDDAGKTISESNNWRRSEAVCRKLEEKYQLQKLPDVRNEHKINHGKLKGRDAFKSTCHVALQQVLKEAKSIEQFNLLLKKKNIDSLWRYNPDGSIRGLSFSRNEMKIKASEINRIYSGRSIAAYIERAQYRKQGKTSGHINQAKRLTHQGLENFSQALDSRRSIEDDIIRIDRVVNNPITKKFKYGR